MHEVSFLNILHWIVLNITIIESVIDFVTFVR